MIKKEEIIDLTDSSHNNTMPFIKELSNEEANLIDDNDNNNDTDDENLPSVIPEDTVKKRYELVFQTANEDRIKGIDHHLSSHFPEDPEPWFEEQLDDNGATITQSITHFPASNTTLTKRSMTSEERRSGYYL